MSARAKAVVAAVAAAVALAWALWARELPVPFAAVVAAAFGALAYYAVRAWDRLRPHFRRPGDRPPPD